MPPNLALLLTCCFVGFAFWQDRKHMTLVSGAVFWPMLWYMVASTRPLGIWLSVWHIPVPGGGGGLEDGSFIDRSFYLALTLIGVFVLRRRPIDWGLVRRQNGWMVVFALFMLLSITWSSYPYTSFKRFIKMAGSIVMALVILTEEHPFEAIKALIRRCAYISLPMSVLCVKYFRDLGVSFDWFGGSESWQGITTSKNVLGQVALVAVLYFIYDVIHRWRQVGWRNLSFAYIFLGAYLLKGSDKTWSMTSVVVFAFGLFLFLRLELLRNRREAIRPFLWKMTAGCFALIILVAIHSVVMFKPDSLFGLMVTTVGRNITFTDRTTIWSQVYEAAASNPLGGVGFGGFWIGREANIEFTQRMTWTLGQAHNGYVDTYLQTGWIGIFLLTGTLLTASRRLLAEVPEDFETGRWKAILFLTTLFVNITETSHLRGDHHLWLLFLLALLNVSGAVEGQVHDSEGDELISEDETPAATRRETVQVFEPAGFPGAGEEAVAALPGAADRSSSYRRSRGGGGNDYPDPA